LRQQVEQYISLGASEIQRAQILIDDLPG